MFPIVVSGIVFIDFVNVVYYYCCYWSLLLFSLLLLSLWKIYRDMIRPTMPRCTPSGLIIMYVCSIPSISCCFIWLLFCYWLSVICLFYPIQLHNCGCDRPLSTIIHVIKSQCWILYPRDAFKMKKIIENLVIFPTCPQLPFCYYLMRGQELGGEFDHKQNRRQRAHASST